MDNYVKAEKDEEFTPDITIDGTKDNVTVMRVKSGSKTKNLIQVMVQWNPFVTPI